MRGFGVERRDLEIFLALADELHFGRTAERLHVSQARVSQTIKKLERRIGAALFERTSRRVELTPIGRRLRDDILPGYQQITDGVARAVAAGRGVSGVLRIGFEAPGVADLIHEVISTFRERHPACEVQIREADFGNPLGTLRNGEVDVLITVCPIEEPDLTTGPVVLCEPVVLAVSSRHSLAQRETVSLEDLAQETVFRASWTPPSDLTVRYGHSVGTFQELLAVVAAGDGVCPLAVHATQYFARPSITFVPLPDAHPVEWGLTWRTSGETSLVRAFGQAAREHAVELR